MPKKIKRPAVDPEPLHDEEFDVHSLLENFWPTQASRIENLTTDYFRDLHSNPELPLARIKKIMKLDDEVKTQMISGEVPIILSKAIEMYVEELTLRGWIHTDENKRKTLQKTDVALAVANCDQFDFLIDIVPREEWLKPVPPKKVGERVHQVSKDSTRAQTNKNAAVAVGNGSGVPPQISTQTVSNAKIVPPQFVLNRGNQGASFVATPSTATNTPQQVQSIQLQNGQTLQAMTVGQPLQLITGPNGELQLVQQQQQPQHLLKVVQQNKQSATSNNALVTGGQQQQQQSGNSASAEEIQQQTPQLFQQIVSADGSVQHVPLQIQLSPSQLQMLKAQYATGNTSNVSNSTNFVTSAPQVQTNDNNNGSGKEDKSHANQKQEKSQKTSSTAKLILQHQAPKSTSIQHGQSTNVVTVRLATVPNEVKTKK